VGGGFDFAANAEHEAMKPGLELTCLGVASDEQGVGAEGAMEDAFAVAEGEGAGDLFDEGYAFAKGDRRILTEERVEGNALIEGVEEDGGAYGCVGDVVGELEDIGVFANFVEELGFAVCGAAELLASFDAGLLGDEVDAGASSKSGVLAVKGEAVLVAGSVFEDLAELVGADVHLCLCARVCPWP